MHKVDGRVHCQSKEPRSLRFTLSTERLLCKYVLVAVLPFTKGSQSFAGLMKPVIRASAGMKCPCLCRGTVALVSGSEGRAKADPVVLPCLLSPSSFSWLCGHVHRNILSKFTGQAVELFDEEFRRLYASSKPLMGLKSPRLVAPLQSSKGPEAPNGRLSGSSDSASDRTSSNPFSSLSTGSNTHNRSLSTSSGPGSPLAPIPPVVPRLQPYHSTRRAVAPQDLLVPMRPHKGAPAPYSSLMAYRPTRLQLQELGLVPRVTQPWRPFLQALPHF